MDKIRSGADLPFQELSQRIGGDLGAKLFDEVSPAPAHPSPENPTAAILTLSEAQAQLPAWRALSADAIEKNPFFGPDFLPAYMRHLGPAALRLHVLRDSSGWLAMMPVAQARPGLGLAGRAATVWSHNFAPLGTPLIAPRASVADLGSLFAQVAHEGAALAIPYMRLDGPAYDRVERALVEGGFSLRLAEKADRAILDCTASADAYLDATLSSSRRRRLRRQRRNLASEGRFTTRWARDPEAAREAFEAFLCLEFAGWKGRGGSAILCREDRAHFTREAVGAMADAGQIGALELVVDGRPVAVTIFLLDGGEGFAWKTAYNEALGRHSPGQLAIIEAMNYLMDPQSGIEEIDSLTEPGHTMIEPLWAQRMSVGTVLAGRGLLAGLRLAAVAADIRAHHGARAGAKRLLSRLKSLRRTAASGSA